MRGKSGMQATLAVLLVVGFLGLNAAFVYAYLDKGGDLPTVGVACFMALINFAGIAVGYYLGSSKGSQDKDDLLRPPV